MASVSADDISIRMVSVSAGSIRIQIDQGFLEKWNTLTEREKLAVATDYKYQARNKYRIDLRPSKLCPTLLDLKNNIIKLENVTVSSIFINLEAEAEQKFRLIVWIFNRGSNEFLSCFIKLSPNESKQFSFNIYSRNYRSLNQLNSIQKGEASKGWNKRSILRAISDQAAGRGLFVANVATGGRGAGKGMVAASVGGGTGDRRGRSKARKGGGQGFSSSKSRPSSVDSSNSTGGGVQRKTGKTDGKQAGAAGKQAVRRSASVSPQPKPKAPVSPKQPRKTKK